MADIMVFDWVTQNLMNGRGVDRLDNTQRPARRLKRYPLMRQNCVMRHIIFRVTLMTSSSVTAAGRAWKVQSVEQNHFPSHALCGA